MEFSEQNQRVLKELRPQFYEAYLACENNQHENCMEISVLETRSGNGALCVTKNQQNYRLNSTYSPEEEARRWGVVYEFPNLCTVIEMYGLGNGVFVRELLSKIKEDDSLILYEPSVEIFTFCLSHFDLTDIFLNPSVFLYVNGVNEYDLERCIQKKLQWFNMNFHTEITHPIYAKAFKEEYQRYQEVLENSKQTVIINQNTDAFLGKIAVNNIFLNMKYLIGSNLISDLKGKIPKELPAIIISAGPSLQKNIEELKRAKGKAVLFAVDTTISYLEAHEIVPDFIITIDPRKSSRHFCGEYIKQVPVIAKLEAKPDALDRCGGRKLFYSSHIFLARLYDSVGILVEDYTSGGSVATAAYSVCVALEFERIILVGQDLAYDGEFTHIGDRKERRKGSGLGLRDIEGIYGDPVKTRYDWLVYLQWFEGAIHSFPNIMCIDATEGGAKIKGSVIMTLKDAIDTYCTREFCVDEMLTKVEPTLNHEKQLEVLHYLVESCDDIDDIEKKSEQILRSIQKIIEIYKKRGINQEVQRLTDRIKQLSGEIEKKNIYQICDTYMTAFADKQLADIYQIDDNNEGDTLKTFYLSRDMYEHMQQITDEIRPLMEEMLKQFRQRMECEQ